MFTRITFAAAAVLALAITVFSAGDAHAGKSGSLTATISLSGSATFSATSSQPVVYGDATFAVTRSVPYDDVIYVSNQCWDGAGNKVLDRDTAVMWGTPTSLVGATNPMPTAGVTCTAYVTIRPWQDKTLGDAIMSFSVGQ